MTQPAHPPSARARADRAEAIKRAWQAGRPPDAAAALKDDPDIAADRAVALDLAYEEFCAREEAGEVLDSAAFCANFPFGASLRRLLAVHRFLDDHPDALGGRPARWPAAGEAVGDFRLLRELGRGSFSRVYLAREATAGDRPVALKVSVAGSREAETLGPLSHPHLIPVLSSRAADGWNVVAMPFAGTATLEDVLSAVWPAGRCGPSAAALLAAAAVGGRADDPPFPRSPAFPVCPRMAYEDAVAAVAAGLFSAVAYLHERGVVHRDLKPSNVLFGPGGHPYLLDFNLASRAADPWRVVGTLPYMAPEQLRLMADATGPEPAAAPPARGAGDVFACGAILFELLTGRHPFAAPGALVPDPRRDRAAAALLAAQRAGHPPLAALNPRVRRAVRDAVARCLALDPAARPTAAELAELFSRGRRRPWRSAVAVLAGTTAVAVALGYPALGPAPPAGPAAAATDPMAVGLELYRQGQPELAAVKFLDAGKAGRDGRAYAYAGYCLSLGQYPAGAISAADDAIRLGNGTAAVYANRAYNHLRSDRPGEAKIDCDTALGLEPNLVPALYTRSVARLRLHLRTRAPVPPEAVADIDRVTAAVPNDPEVWVTAAQLDLVAGGSGLAQRDKAAAAVRNAVLAGKPTHLVECNPVFKDALRGHPVYEAALKLTPGPVVPGTNPHLVNPIE
jgi:serine/threonine protein kinase